MAGDDPSELEGAASVWGAGYAVWNWGESCNYVNLGLASTGEFICSDQKGLDIAVGAMGGAVALTNSYQVPCKACSGN